MVVREYAKKYPQKTNHEKSSRRKRPTRTESAVEGFMHSLDMGPSCLRGVEVTLALFAGNGGHVEGVGLDNGGSWHAS